MSSNSCLEQAESGRAEIAVAAASVRPDEQQRGVTDQEDVRRRTGSEAERHRQRLARDGPEAVQSRAHRQQQLVGLDQLTSASNSYPVAAALSHKVEELGNPCQLIVTPEQFDTGPSSPHAPVVACRSPVGRGPSSGASVRGGYSESPRQGPSAEQAGRIEQEVASSGQPSREVPDVSVRTFAPRRTASRRGGSPNCRR